MAPLPPPMQRQLSSASAHTAASSSASTTSAKKSSRAKDLLRDYYGLAGSEGGPQADKAGTNEDPMNLDLPSFSAPIYLQTLLNTSSLAQLLKTSTTLSASISDLESERQSLVYNHHHELIDASITISKMKVRAESLDTTLEQLKVGLARCSELESGLRYPASGKAIPDEQSKQEPDWDIVLGKMLDLPLTMQSASKDEALRLWGTYEPVLRRWREAGVQGIEEVEAECREVLNAAELSPDTAGNRRRSASLLTIRPS